MKKNRRLDNLIEQMVHQSFENDTLNEKKVEEYIKLLKQLPGYEAIYTLTKLQQGLQRELNKRTLIIESATGLTEKEINEIKKKFLDRFTIVSTESRMNAAVLGGLIVRIGDMVFDFSVKNRIDQVRETIRG